MSKGFIRNETGAVAPLVAISLFALVAVAGIAFDYARLAAMDSELQNAADQAALAAATQLDGQTGAMNRATAAANTLVANTTRFANDAGGTGVTIASVTFYTCSAITCGNKSDMTVAATDEEAKYVEVTVGSRRAFYALTPVVGALSSGPMDAVALAGLHSAICKVPPVMICNPGELTGDADFTVANYIGKGLRLVSVGGGGGAWAPGNFGYLDAGMPIHNKITLLKQSLGWATPPGNCSPISGVDTLTGASTPVTDALNTRFDIYSTGSCPSGDACPPSINTVKDVVRRADASGGNSCQIGPQGWDEPTKKYLPTSQTADWTYDSTTKPDAMGYPRDKCHAATGALCPGAVGDGNWDRNAYFGVNYNDDWGQNWPSYTGLCTAGNCNGVTRYQVYQWEIDHRGQTIGGQTILASRIASGSGSTALIDHDRPVCSPLQGYGTGVVPGGDTLDRRRLTIAVINCSANNVHGSSADVPVRRWIDAFLVEPSMTRNRNAPQVSTGQQDVYVEVINETEGATEGGTTGHVVRRDVPYLVE